MNKRSSCSNIIAIDRIITRHAEKLRHWCELLREVMPCYFFQTFSVAQIEEILPLLFNLDHSSGIQKISKGENIILIYLKNQENNILTTSKLMMGYNIHSAVIHESCQKIVIDNTPRTLVIEHYTVANEQISSANPRFSLKELTRAYRQQYGQASPRINDVYSRINWDAVADLTLEKMSDRLHHVLAIQDVDYPDITVEKCESGELRITFARTNSPAKVIYYKIVDTMNQLGFTINRAYARQITRQDEVTSFVGMPVTITTLYIDGKKLSPTSKKVQNLVWQLRHISWCDAHDLLHQELVDGHHWGVADANLLRAAAAFIHSQLAFVDRNAYEQAAIWRLMALYEPILRDLLALFQSGHQAKSVALHRDLSAMTKQIHRKIAAVNTGMHDKDVQIRTILTSLLNFIGCIEKTNFYVENKACLSFRLNPAFMSHYESLSSNYATAFPADRPCGIFFFFRDNCLSFHVRFAEIARGGWRTVVPQSSRNLLEKNDSYEFANDELFREVFVLAHTQHMKNKDIYEGGAKMISLLYLDGMDFKKALYHAQRTTCAAFLQLITYDQRNRLKEPAIVDRLGGKEIIEIGPDENMHDAMIAWMGDYAESVGYTLGSGFISGKADCGINHKEYGVTSFGVHQYLLKTLKKLGITPENMPFSLKISGGPYGDVAGNEMKLLLQKKADGTWLYPFLKIIAITDGPAAIYDPAGIDRNELSRLVLSSNLDAFLPEKLSADGAYIAYSQPVETEGVAGNRIIFRHKAKLVEKVVLRDEFMRIFQHNLYHYADVFVPCGGRPSTIDASIWQDYCPSGNASSKAIVEGANSFITPAARDHLQNAGVLIVKDASANKCGVITSSYEIISGLMLSKYEFKSNKIELVHEIMENLRRSANLEADWLFAKLESGERMTELTERLSAMINAQNFAIQSFLVQHPQYIQDNIILDHLPKIFREKFPDRVNRIPDEYKKALVAVELATRIVYYHSDDLAEQIESVIKKHDRQLLTGSLNSK